jgi:uncharacterized protein YdbL (DUF1318 family)
LYAKTYNVSERHAILTTLESIFRNRASFMTQLAKDNHMEVNDVAALARKLWPVEGEEHDYLLDDV